MPGLLSLSDPQFPFQVSYPDPTPAGYPVELHLRQGEQSYRLHLISEGSAEVYFEVGRYEQLERQAAIEQFLAEVSNRFDGLRISPVVEMVFNGQTAARFTIQWPGRARAILFFERDGVLFRIIYDPRSAINLDILASFEWVTI